MWKQGLRK
ncbi:hypothetical protein CIB84_004366 [Bambusicola thoracicus]|uniref:Uncharacterized protein n=1 Tax=Bambusicola thoracicus TaxID=9083 RepID=A0A2P4T686_BAMTH|nr:hypothetical protein CIB84_004366 [Bambusicola thoracicus]